MSRNRHPENGPGHRTVGSPGTCGDSMVKRTNDTLAVVPLATGTLLSRCRPAGGKVPSPATRKVPDGRSGGPAQRRRHRVVAVAPGEDRGVRAGQDPADRVVPGRVGDGRVVAGEPGGVPAEADDRTRDRGTAVLVGHRAG